MKILTPLLFCLICSSAFSASIDQRDPGYQAAMEELTSASIALTKALNHLKKADAAYPLPMLNIVKMHGQVSPVNTALIHILYPEEKRLKAKELVPDSIFFNKVSLSESQ